MKKIDRLESLKFRANPCHQRRITPFEKSLVTKIDGYDVESTDTDAR